MQHSLRKFPHVESKFATSLVAPPGVASSGGREPGEFVLITPKAKASAPSCAGDLAVPSDKEDKRPPISPINLATLGKGLVRGKGKAMKSSSLPPRINVTTQFSHTYRFVSTDAGAHYATVASLLGVGGAVGTITNSQVTCFASSVKVNWVMIWPSASSSGSTSPEIAWGTGTSGQVPDRYEIESIPEGLTVSRALRFVPPAKSLASFWVESSFGSSVILDMIVPVGSIIDINLSMTLSNIYNATNVSVSTATIGGVYYLALDGASSNKYTPVGLISTH